MLHILKIEKYVLNKFYFFIFKKLILLIILLTIFLFHV